MDTQRIVGWAKALALLLNKGSLACAVPTISLAARIDSVGGHGVRESLIGVEGCASAFTHPTVQSIFVESKENRPLFAALARGSPAFLSSVSLENRGGWRADKAHCPDYSGRVVRITPDDGREASRPAPCGAPTRYLGLYAFDRGRTGPARSGRRGCPSTARGRRLRLPPARRCRSRSPPTERLRKAPLEEWIGIGSG